jgi:hypothetical protein
MRLATIAMILFLVGPPAFAESEGPDTPRRECNRLTSQIARYEGDVELARERGNELWEKATRDQIERLSGAAPAAARSTQTTGLRRRCGNSPRCSAAPPDRRHYFTPGAL